ncbi:Alanine aminotransferase 2 [Seminavis robusta]|uniref:Alanine aminotransferase 2 n=1 Tax=Seminavis robusta TaxID=568900 RepID=A0A9N8EMS9_9STRA|nr:Alanine aminotransferase 2 [Seminavis robusta]|eukprot:Sro1489_g276950.1 Alanine aminotransferase 2 (526) ;mRNA; r:14180-15757
MSLAKALFTSTLARRGLPIQRVAVASNIRWYSSDKRLTEDTMSQNIRNMEYAVRGQVVIAADALQHELEENPQSHTYTKVLYTNVGNPHQVGQESLQWPRQVMALCNLPPSKGIDHPELAKVFPQDVIDRAREISHVGLGDQGTGAYSHSQGHLAFRQDIAKFIEQRDGGVTSNPEHIFMCNGASSGIEMILDVLLNGPDAGIMIPIPQYPIYSAAIACHGAHQVGYYLEEEKGWSMDMDHLEQQLADAKAKGINVVGFVLINPGNPTGQVLTRQALCDVVTFCAKHKLVLLSDEVYQDNVYDENAEFVSAKRAAWETGLLEQDAIELISFHSTSKGLYGECGHRGGYMEVVGMDASVEGHLYKLASSGLCPNLDGQILMDLMVRGPDPWTESHREHEAQKRKIYDELKAKAKLMTEGLNSIDGFSCQPAQGSMYCFPAIEMPPGAIAAAKQQGMAVDTYYALSLLESTGICVVPAAGFGQKPGRHGFRTTFLPSIDDMKQAIKDMRKHHEEFCARHSEESSKVA